MEEAQVDWAGLHGDLLTCIGELLAVPGRICFRAVCRTWRAAIQEEAGAMPSPWVVVPDVEGGSNSFTFISAPTMNSFRWAPPGGTPARCVGSNGGWLAMVTLVDSQHIGISLVNPLTDARVELPPVTGWQVDPPPRLSDRWRMRFETPPITSWQVDPAAPSDWEGLLDTVVRKVAFSPSPSPQDYAVAIVSRAGETVMYTTSAITCWRKLHKKMKIPSNGNRRRELDVAYHDGKFYYMWTTGLVLVVDITCADVEPYPAPVWVDLFYILKTAFVPFLSRGYHLAFSGDGALHVVWSHSPGDQIKEQLQADSGLTMLVMRYQPGSDPLWTQATNLGSHALLIGDRNQSLSVPVDMSSNDHTWLRPDSVYFANTPLSNRLANIVGPPPPRRGSMWVYDLETCRIRRLAELDSKLDWLKSLWFTPCMT